MLSRAPGPSYAVYKPAGGGVESQPRSGLHIFGMTDFGLEVGAVARRIVNDPRDVADGAFRAFAFTEMRNDHLLNGAALSGCARGRSPGTRKPRYTLIKKVVIGKTTARWSRARARRGAMDLDRLAFDDASADEQELPSEVHPVRRLAPVRKKYTRGSRRTLDRCGGDVEAIRKLRDAKMATTLRAPMSSRLRWWRGRCLARGIKPLPDTPAKLELAYALLLRGGYRFAAAYISAVKRSHVANFEWTAQHVLVNADAKRAISRGQGPALQADPIPIEDIVEKVSEEQVAVVRNSNWPVEPIAAAVVTCAWLLREIESSAALLDSVTIHPSSGSCPPPRQTSWRWGRRGPWAVPVRPRCAQFRRWRRS